MGLLLLEKNPLTGFFEGHVVRFFNVMGARAIDRAADVISDDICM